MQTTGDAVITEEPAEQAALGGEEIRIAEEGGAEVVAEDSAISPTTAAVVVVTKEEEGAVVALDEGTALEGTKSNNKIRKQQ